MQVQCKFSLLWIVSEVFSEAEKPPKFLGGGGSTLLLCIVV